MNKQTTESWIAGKLHKRLAQALVCAFVLMVVASLVFLKKREKIEPHLLDIGANYAPLTLTGEPWRLLTSVFVHVELLHLLVFAYVLWSLGGRLERILGSLRFGVLYLLSCAGANLAGAWWQLTDTGSKLNIFAGVGATGGTMGLVGAAGFLMLYGHLRRTSVAEALGIQSLTLLKGIAWALGLCLIPAVLDWATTAAGLVIGFVCMALLYGYGVPLATPLRKPGWVARMRPVAQALVVGTVGAVVIAKLATLPPGAALLAWKAQVLSGQNNLSATANTSNAATAYEKAQEEMQERRRELERQMREAWEQERALMGTPVFLADRVNSIALDPADQQKIYFTGSKGGYPVWGVVDTRFKARTESVKGTPHDMPPDTCQTWDCLGAGATGIAVGLNWAWVTNLHKNSVTRVNLPTGAIDGVAHLGFTPSAITLSADHSQLYALNASTGKVTVLDLARWPAVLGTLQRNPASRAADQPYTRPGTQPLALWLATDSPTLLLGNLPDNELYTFDTREPRAPAHEYKLQNTTPRRLLQAPVGDGYLWYQSAGQATGQSANMGQRAEIGWATPGNGERLRLPVCNADQNMHPLATNQDATLLAVYHSKDAILRVYDTRTRTMRSAWRVPHGVKQVLFPPNAPATPVNNNHSDTPESQRLYTLDWQDGTSQNLTLLPLRKEPNASDKALYAEYLCPLPK